MTTAALAPVAIVGSGNIPLRANTPICGGGWRGPAWKFFDADFRQARLARSWIRRAVKQYDGPADPDDAELVTNELFVNAVQHGPKGGLVMVGYCCWAEGIRIVVADGGGYSKPRLRLSGNEFATSGRGLWLVDELSAVWGIHELPGAQVVWSDLRSRMPVHGGNAWAWLRLVLSSCELAPRSFEVGS